MATKHLTITAKWLRHAAQSIETDANESLTAWILCGNHSAYCLAMPALQIAKHFLRRNGIEA